MPDGESEFTTRALEDNAQQCVLGNSSVSQRKNDGPAIMTGCSETEEVLRRNRSELKAKFGNSFFQVFDLLLVIPFFIFCQAQVQIGAAFQTRKDQATGLFLLE
jgi:hypothetical protein